MCNIIKIWIRKEDGEVWNKIVDVMDRDREKNNTLFDHIYKTILEKF